MIKRPEKPSGSSVGRGVWFAPWLGPNGETIIVSIRRDGRILDEQRCPFGAGVVDMADMMWDRLDAEDDQPSLTLVHGGLS